MTKPRIPAVAYAYRHYGEVLWRIWCGPHVILVIGSRRPHGKAIVRAEVFVREVDARQAARGGARRGSPDDPR